jgi:DNA-binding transcriptional MerR regulator
MEQQTFTLDQICTLAALPKRTVRYYIQIGLLPRPVGENRGARYLEMHLETLLKIKQLTEAGLSLERVRDIVAGEPLAIPARPKTPGSVEVRSHIWIAPGVELQISADEAGASPEQVRALARVVLQAWNKIKEENNEE